MSKELGYIKIDDVLELVKLVHRVHMETDHYASIQFSNYGYDITVASMKNGFSSDKKYDLLENFSLYNSRRMLHEVNQYRKIRDYLKDLLGEL